MTDALEVLALTTTSVLIEGPEMPIRPVLEAFEGRGRCVRVVDLRREAGTANELDRALAGAARDAVMVILLGTPIDGNVGATLGRFARGRSVGARHLIVLCPWVDSGSYFARSFGLHLAASALLSPSSQ